MDEWLIRLGSRARPRYEPTRDPRPRLVSRSWARGAMVTIILRNFRYFWFKHNRAPILVTWEGG
jgi:hypothetical protein